MGSPRKFAYVLYSLIKASIFSLSQPFVCFDLLSECWLFWQSTFFQIVERSNVLVLFFPRLRLALWRFVTHHAMWPQLCRCCLFQKPPRHGPLRVRAWRLGIPAPGMLPPQQTPLQNSPACSLGHYHYHQASLSHPKTMQIVPWDSIITIRHPSVTPKQRRLFPGTLLILLPSGIPVTPKQCIQGT